MKKRTKNAQVVRAWQQAVAVNVDVDVSSKQQNFARRSGSSNKMAIQTAFGDLLNARLESLFFKIVGQAAIRIQLLRFLSNYFSCHHFNCRQNRPKVNSPEMITTFEDENEEEDDEADQNERNRTILVLILLLPKFKSQKKIKLIFIIIISFFFLACLIR